MALDRKARERIAKNTIDRSPAIVAEHKEQGAQSGSVFIANQLPALQALDPRCPNPGHAASAVEIRNSDSFTAAREILAADPTATGHLAVLNLASDILPAGPWLQVMTTTQEEALCYSSTLYITLKESYYPWPNLGEGCVAGIYSPGVVIFRDDLDHNCVELPIADRRVVSVLTVAAPAWPKLTPDRQAFAEPSTLAYLQEKIRLVYRMAAHNGQENLVLGVCLSFVILSSRLTFCRRDGMWCLRVSAAPRCDTDAGHPSGARIPWVVQEGCVCDIQSPLQWSREFRDLRGRFQGRGGVNNQQVEPQCTYLIEDVPNSG
jgi:uncharacterized protein (TIGR02452 family)